MGRGRITVTPGFLFLMAWCNYADQQGLLLPAQVGDQVGLLVDWQIHIALLGEQLDELTLQRRLALVAVGTFFTGS